MKSDDLSSLGKSDMSPTKKSSRSKRKIPRICGIKVKTYWKIRKQFMSSIYILNGLFLLLITIIVLLNQIGFRYLTFKFTESKLSDNQKSILNTMAIELAQGLGSKLSYYFQVGTLFGRLIEDMLFQHTNTKIFNAYPLNQPNSSTIPNLTQWGFVGTAGVNVELQEYYRANLRALNYFADELMTTHDNIPISSLYATFFDNTFVSFLSLGYPKNTSFEKPSYLSDNWYSRALKSSTGKAVSYRVSNVTVYLQFSKLVLKPDNNPFCVVLVEINATSLTQMILDKYYRISRNSYKSIITDYYGNVLASTTDLKLIPASGAVPLINTSSTLGISNDTWTYLRNQMLLVNASVASYIDPLGNAIYLTGNQLILPIDIPLYNIILYPESIAQEPIDYLENKLIDESVPNILIVLAIMFVLCLIVFGLTIKRSRRYLAPFLAISDYAEKKVDQMANPDVKNRDIETVKLIEGDDEIGELVNQFKKLISGLSAIKNETQETIPKFEDEKHDYPRNYYKGKFMPWRNALQQLQIQQAPTEGTEIVKEKKQVGGTKLNLIKKK